MKIHPIPPGLWCVPSALVALTGDDWESVIQPALNRHAGADTLTGMVVGSTMQAAIATLQERRYKVLRCKTLGQSRRRLDKVATWAATKYPGESFLVALPEHAAALHNGRIYDSWTPHGAPAAEHAFKNASVSDLYLVRKGG